MTTTELTDARSPLEPQCEWRARRRSATATCSSSPTRTSPSSTPRSCTRESQCRRRARHHPRAVPAADARRRSSTRITRELIDGRGVVLIRGVPVDRYGKDARVGDLLGRRDAPRAARGRRTPRATCSATSPTRARAVDDPTSRGNEIGGVAFPFHSDGSDLVGLFCLDAGASGGASLVANAVDDPQRAGAHRARARGRAVRAVPVRLPRRAGARREALVHDAGLQPAAATGCSCATSGRTSSRPAATTTRPARRTRRARR